MRRVAACVYIFADLIFYFSNRGNIPRERRNGGSLMRLSVKNERPLYNAYRGDIRRRRPRSLFVPSIRDLISHESERRLSPFPPSLVSTFGLPLLSLSRKTTHPRETSISIRVSLLAIQRRQWRDRELLIPMDSHSHRLSRDQRQDFT